MKRILFVCTGNTCRSSMAEGIFKDAISQNPDLGLQFEGVSAGIYAYEGDRASHNSVKALKEGWDIDISTHKARRISVDDIRDSYLILTMTREHKEAVISICPEARNKVFTLKEFASDRETDHSIEQYNFALDITDPYGMPEAVYKRCADEIKDAVEKAVAKLKKAR